METGWAELQEILRPEYELLRLLGRGAMGAVYLAREPGLDRVVAIKVLPSGKQSDAQRARLCTEARIVAKLNHPNIVPLHRLLELGPFVCFVMAVVHGESLGSRLRREGAIAPDETRRLLAEIAGALDYAHRRGVVHLDVKPDNILIEDESGRPLLADFGIARTQASASELDEENLIVGTPAYLSPEQTTGADAIDGRSDLYALGIIGFEMLTGARPFHANDLPEMLRQHLYQQPPSLPREVAPSDLSEIVNRCLQKQPSSRFSDGASLRKVLLAGASHVGRLPAELEQLPWGGWMILLTLGSAFLPFVNLGILDQPIRFLWIALGLAWTVAGLLARKRGFPWSSIVSAVLRQPAWWPGLWYPSRYRRPFDLWDRLPHALRWGRTLFAGGLSVFLLTGVAIEVIFAWAARSSETLNALVNSNVVGSFTRFHLLNTTILVGPVLMASGFILANRWANRRGLDWKDKLLVFTQPAHTQDLWRSSQLTDPSKRVEAEISRRSDAADDATVTCAEDSPTIARDA